MAHDVRKEITCLKSLHLMSYLHVSMEIENMISLHKL